MAGSIRRIPIEAKESYRWLESLRRVREVAQEVPGTRCILVADSESDIYEVLAEPRGATRQVDWIIRACHDRATVPAEDETAGQLRAAVVEVRAAEVDLRPPWRPDRKLPPVRAHVVQAREVDPPAGEEPVEWLLITTLPIDTIDDVRTIIQYYTIRWMMEVFFRVLKSGCRVERRRFEHVDRELRFIAVALVVAWRVLMVCRLGRSCPDLDCEAIFEPSEWKSVYVAVHRCAPPEQPPRLGEMIRLIAQLGGYVNTPKRKDPPGPQTLWLGMQRMSDLAWAWETFGPGTQIAEVSTSAAAQPAPARHSRAPKEIPRDV
jgi:hypothetical protein